MSPPLLLLTSALAVAASSVPRAALERCRAIDDAAARVACYDKLVDATVTQADADVVTGPAPDTDGTTSAAATGEALFGRSAGSVREMSEQALGTSTPDEIESAISSCRLGANRKWVIRLENAQVWAQTDTVPLQLQPGDRVRIRRAALGAHRLKRLKGGRVIAVKRMDAN